MREDRISLDGVHKNIRSKIDLQCIEFVYYLQAGVGVFPVLPLMTYSKHGVKHDESVAHYQSKRFNCDVFDADEYAATLLH